MRLWVLAAGLIVQFTACAQSTIHGCITGKDGAGLAGVNVYIEDTYDGTTTDEKGMFELKTAERGARRLKIEILGFKAVLKEVDLDEGVISISVVLEEAFSVLDAVVITAGSFEAGDKKRAIALSSLDIASTAGAMGDIIGAINTLPGATRVGESGRLFVRGGSSEETRTFIDNMQVGTPYYATVPNVSTRGRFNPFLFSGTVFNTGGYSAEFGQAMSSVLLLNTTEAKLQDELNLSFLGMLGGDITGTKSWASGSITASGTYFNMNRYAELVQQNQQWQKPMEMISNEISVKQRTGQAGMLKLYTNVNTSHFSMVQNNLDAPGEQITYDQRNKNVFVNASLKNSITDRLKIFSGLAVTYNDDAIIVDYIQQSEDLRTAHAKGAIDYQLTEKIDFHFGGEYFYTRYKKRHAYDSLMLRHHLDNDVLAGYVESNIYTSKKFVMRVGGRMEYAVLLKKCNAAPRLSTAYKIDDKSQLSFAYGHFYQLPFNDDLIQTRDVDFERADHFLFNYQRSFLNRIVRGEVYYKRYSSLIRYDENLSYTRSNYTNVGHGYAYGFDFFFRDSKSIKNAHYWISYSFLQTERYHRNFPVLSIPSFASKHNFSIVYKHFSSQLRSMISSDFSYSSSRRYHDPNKEGFNNSVMKPYGAVNLSWAYLFRRQVIFYIAVNNLSGRSNQFGYRFSNMPNDKGEYVKEAIKPSAQRFYLVGVFFTFSKDKAKNQLDIIN